VLTGQQRQAASDLLWELWQHGRRVVELPAELRPATREEGYAVQALLERRSAYPVFGWKIAATSQAGQQHIGVDGPLAGRLLRERVVTGGEALKLGANQMRVAEPEFAFRIGRPLAPRASSYLVDEVMAAVDALHPAIELPDSRYDDFAKVGAAQLIADNACAHQFVLGPAAMRQWRTRNLADHVVIGIVAGKFRREGKGANVLGDPRAALTWLVNELSRLGIALEAGQVVTTGTCVPPLPVEPGDHTTADFGELGRVEVRFEGEQPMMGESVNRA
jgi:2-keto-4-pentenoate hydratase